VSASDGPAWLRVSHAAKGRLVDTFWTGAVEAHEHIPPSVPRPALRLSRDWIDSDEAYRAELYDHAGASVIDSSTAITSSPALPGRWWAEVRAALAAIATISTLRMTIQPGFLNWAMPHYLMISHANYTAIPWVTAHGDFHFGNLCGPRLAILDWEGWGLAPPGYDAATLHSYSLLVPEATTQIARELGNLLGSPGGQYAELAVITEMLHAATQGIHPELTEALRQRAAAIVESPISSLTSP
jgi:hypothetical protein